MINKKSRYYGSTTRKTVGASAEPVELLELRAIPPTPAVLSTTVGPGQRLDHLAARYYREPRRFWRISDAAEELDPFDLAIPGVSVLIPPDK